MNNDIIHDPNSYFRNLQQIATEQDRAKFAALAAEFGNTLHSLPKLKKEIDAILITEQQLDYADLAKNIRPKLEQAAKFLFDVDQLPTELRTAREVADFVQSAKITMALQTIEPMVVKFSPVCISVRQRIDRDKADRAKAEQRKKEEADRAKAEQRKKEEADRVKAEQRKKEEADRAKAEQQTSQELWMSLLGIIGVGIGAFIGWDIMEGWGIFRIIGMCIMGGVGWVIGIIIGAAVGA